MAALYWYNPWFQIVAIQNQKKGFLHLEEPGILYSVTKIYEN